MACTLQTSAGWPVELSVLSPNGRQCQGCRLEQSPGNVSYLAYIARHERTAQSARRHCPGRQRRRRPARPGSIRGRRQPGSLEQERQYRQRAHGRRGHLRSHRRRGGPALGGPRLPSPLPSSQTRSRPRIGSGHPAGERLVPAVVRRLEEHRLPELAVAAVAGDADVSHTAAARGGFPGWFAHARRPAHLRLAGPQLVTERAGFRLVLEQGSGHLNDHARTSCYESMITVTCTDDQWWEASPRARRRGAASWLMEA
jgi:hypothetical protein